MDQSKRMNASEALKHPWIVVRKNTTLKFVFDNILMNGTIVKKETIFNAREDIPQLIWYYIVYIPNSFFISL